MKVKYSNKIKDDFSKELLNDMVLLSYIVIPREKYHLYSIKEISDSEIQIIHSIPSIGFKSTVIRKRNPLEIYSSQTVMLIFVKDTLYVCTEDEFNRGV